MLDQDKSIVTNLASLLDDNDDDAHDKQLNLKLEDGAYFGACLGAC